MGSGASPAAPPRRRCDTCVAGGARTRAGTTVSSRHASRVVGIPLAIPCPMALESCTSCDGLVPARARVCPHCAHARSALRGVLARAAGLAAGGLAAMTLMACYGGPAYYDDCVDQDDDGWFPACYAAACDPEIDPNCDCDDTRPDVYPGAPDSLGDGVDQDCSGADGPGKRRVDAGIDAPDDAEVDAADDAGAAPPPIDALGDLDGV
ncbi:MAG: putative metal-binding motif-containing protein [Myxococcales bacterium]|nr:putative metal-binding motif-containing protein [Myxococcales bacterium]